MTAPTRVILLACGSFNPITNMHLRMFEIAKDALHKTGLYHVVGGIISPVSDAYNKKELVSAKHRCAMIRLALKTSDWIRLDPWESEQEVWSTTLKVLRHHKEALESMYNANVQDTPTKRRRVESLDGSNATYSQQRHEPPAQLKLLCGADLLESFAIPGLWKEKDIEEIMSKYGLACISRQGAHPEKFIYEHDILTKHQTNILQVTEWITNDISATKIRRALRRGESVKYLIQDSVIDYVKTHNLYGAGENEEKYSPCMYKAVTYEETSQFDYKLDTQPTPVQEQPPRRKSAFRFLNDFSCKLLNQMTPSPNREDSVEFDMLPDDHQLLTNHLLSPTRVCYKTVHDSYVSRSVDSDTSSRSHGHRSYRRYRDLNLDEEHRRKDYRRDSSLDSLDSDHSYPIATSRSPNPPRRGVTCIGADLSGLVRRVRGMRVTMTPETCV